MNINMRLFVHALIKQFCVACLFFVCGCSVFQMKASSFIPGAPDDLDMFLPTEPNGQEDAFVAIIGLNAEERHRGNISLAYQVFVEQGVMYKNVFILDMSSNSPIFPKTDTTSLQAVRLLFSRLAKIVEEHDTLFVYFTGHGRMQDADVQLVLNGSEFMSSREVVASLEAIRPAIGIALFDQCYWGPFLHPSTCNWATMTVARHERPSIGNTFSRAYFNGIRRGMSIVDAFAHAEQKDVAASKGENAPAFFAGWKQQCN
jgi:hypothetical protein